MKLIYPEVFNVPKNVTIFPPLKVGQTHNLEKLNAIIAELKLTGRCNCKPGCRIYFEDGIAKDTRKK